ncbi:MoxR family ATPase [Virgisporangium ochraceum]|uniref:ATPase AAA n=1 Tax=Virgisporangium ochraceum TaxID=65505 RepID=A0A8J4EG98_9ACTN|nr:MoxR family ATPase [Virgisporangium ochraceum]GIJ74530.1 ATPase AAA [Virgisporangium ochraceum]
MSQQSATAWWVYRGDGRPHDGIDRLPAAPPWRRFVGRDGADGATERHIGTHSEAATTPDRDTIDLVNAAIYLRRPLLVSGQPGTGKSTLAYSIAHELGLGPVLHWPITSRSTLTDGLYHYDAIGRLQQVNTKGAEPGIGRFLKLGPLGTALLARERPRVLLIDEIDKSDVDLPNDLLNVFEEGTFTIPELERVDDETNVEVFTADPAGRATVEDGRVRCNAFPIVVMTSNNERDFPPAFVRRCLRLHLEPPDRDRLAAIVAAHLGRIDDTVLARIDAFLRLQLDGRERAIDQLLNQVFLAASGVTNGGDLNAAFLAKLVTPLDGDAE